MRITGPTTTVRAAIPSFRTLDLEIAAGYAKPGERFFGA